MLLQMQVWAFLLLQESGAIGWDPRSLWMQMGFMAKAVVVGLFIMSAWSIGVMIDRYLAYRGAAKQSRAFAPAVAGALREGKLDEAIKIADRYKKSHLAKVVVAGLQEFRAHQLSSEIPGEAIEASKRALERAEAIVHAELKRGVGSWQPSVPRPPSWVCSERWSASSTRSREFRPRSRRVSARWPAVFPKRWLPPLSVCSWPSRRHPGRLGPAPVLPAGGAGVGPVARAGQGGRREAPSRR